MRISVASGKGGTGKTLLSICLAEIISSKSTVLVDADVEEPNAGLFFFPGPTQELPVYRWVPAINYEICTLCGKCAEICNFNALVVLRDEVLLFPELCHSCSACYYLCPMKAISEGQHKIGTIEEAIVSGGIKLITGRLQVNEAQSPPLIKASKEKAGDSLHEITIIDCPPGTGCPMIEAIRGSDYCLLVTEPTPFGLHDLKLSLAVVRLLQIPGGIVINKWNGNDAGINIMAEKMKVPILARIPYSDELAYSYARGENLLRTFPDLRTSIENIWQEMKVTNL